MKIHCLIVKGSILLFLISSIISSCDTKTVKKMDVQTQLLPNGNQITVEKTNSETSFTGIFTKHSYGTTHTFRYIFLINPDNIKWSGGSGEPKNILFCKDTLYMKYLKEKSVSVEYIDSIDNQTKEKYYDTIVEVYQQHVDERYFFNLFGNQYWIDIPSEKYYRKKEECPEYLIPNDNELQFHSNR